MQPKPKSNSIVTHTLNEETGVITFTVLGIGTIPFDPAKAAQSNRLHAEVHGWVQRIPDGAAIPRADKDGNLIPESERSQMKFDAMQRLVDHYESGADSWTLAERGDGAQSITLLAVARIQGISYDDAKAMVERRAEKAYAGDTRKALAKLREGATVQRVMAEIRAERTPKPKLDGDAELAELTAENSAE